MTNLAIDRGIQEAYHRSARQWYRGLSQEEKDGVHTWLKSNPPPKDWQEPYTPVDYAFTEMPRLPSFFPF